MQSKPHEGETLAAQKMPTASASVQSHFHHEDGSARGSVQNSTCTPASSFGENKHAGSSVISPGSFHSAQDEHASDLPAYSAVDDIARAPLLGDADPDWDRVSLRESQSRETLI